MLTQKSPVQLFITLFVTFALCTGLPTMTPVLAQERSQSRDQETDSARQPQTKFFHYENALPGRYIVVFKDEAIGAKDDRAKTEAVDAQTEHQAIAGSLRTQVVAPISSGFTPA
jgi:hypothetical protein